MNDSNNAGSSKKGPADLKLIMAVAAIAVIAAFAICIIGSADDSDAEVETWNIGSPTETDVKASYDTETKTLTISGTGAMNGWNHLGDAPWYSYRADITTVVVGDGVTNIGVGAFTNCTSFASFTVPDSVVSIGTAVFHSCSALKNVTVTSKTVPTLGSFVFDDCSADLAILVPSDSVSAYKAAENWSSYSAKIFSDIATCTVDEIGDQAYTGKQITPTVIVKDGDTTLTLDEDYTVSYGENTQLGEGTVTITGIGDYRGTYVKTFNIVVGWNIGAVTETDVIATYNTTTKTLTISGTGAMQDWEKVSQIPWRSYGGVMEKVIIGDNVTNVGNRAFQAFVKINNVVIGSGVITIGENAFAGCSAITAIDLKNVKTIGNGAFSSTGLVSITIPDSVETIGKKAFNSNRSLESVINGSGVKTFGDRSFQNCPNLVTITFGSDVETIDTEAFYQTALTSVSIPSKVSSIGAGAFSYTAITEITVDQNNSHYISVNGVLFSKDLKTIVCYPSKGAAVYSVPDGVEVIEGYCFSYSDITQISMPDSVKTIGDHAFEHCTSLNSVTISENVTSIGNSVFSNCTSLGSVVIPSKVTSIGEYAFNNCTSLGSVVIPGSVASIGNTAFAYCASLGSVTISEGVPSIGDSCFFNCTSLASVSIPSSVTSIGNYAFKNTALSTVAVYGNGSGSSITVGTDAFYGITFKNGESTIDVSSTDFPGHVYHADSGTVLSAVADAKSWDISAEGEENNVTADYNGYTKTMTISGTGAMKSWEAVYTTPWYSYGNEMEKVIIGDSVTNIGNYAFGSGVFKKIDYLSIGSGVTSIGQSAFNGCSAIVAIDLKNVKTIGSNAFGNTGLKSITIPDSVETIDNMAFYSNSSLESVSIGNGVKTIGDNSFGCCSKLATVTFGSNVEIIGEKAFYDTALTSVSISSKVSSIGVGAFSHTAITGITVDENNSNYTSVNGVLFSNDKKTIVCYPSKGSAVYSVPDGVEVIEGYCFAYSDITQVSMPDSVKTIGDSAFDNCTSLNSVTISKNVTSIGRSVFNNCTSLSSVVIPDSVISIGEYAFNNCTSLSSVIIPEGVTSIGNCCFVKCSSLASVTIPGSVTSLGSNAFDNCTSLSSVIIPEGVTSIGNYCFIRCSSLASVSIPSSITSIGDKAFKNTALSTVAVYGNGFGSVSSIEVGADAFYGITFKNGESTVDVSSTEFPGHVYHADSGTVLSAVADAKSWDISATENDSVIASYNGYTKTLTITGTGNMMNWTDNVPWSSYVNEIESVVIENGVTSIGDRAFKGCTSLGSITVPEDISSIGSSAFEGCSILENVTMKSIEVPTLGSNAFNDCSADLKIMVPSESASAYRTAANWSTYADKIVTDFTLCTVEDIRDQNYTGQQITPEVIVKDGATTLVKDTHYSVSYGENVELGEGTVTITGIGNYVGTIEKTFNIVKSESKITVTKTSSCPSGSYNVGATVTSGAALTYEIITGSDIASVDSAGNITAKAIGTAKLKISAAETSTYKAAELTVDITVYDHIHVIVPGTAPTKTATGLTEGEECSECHKVFKEQTSIPATGSEKSVIESKDTDVKYTVPKSDDIKTLTVKLDNAKYIVELNEESTTKVKDTVIEFSVTPVASMDSRYSAVMKSNGSEFTGQMSITLPYDPSKGTPSVKWVEGNEKMSIVSVNETDKTVTFLTTHNSTYEVEYQKSDNTVNGIIIGIVMIATVVLLSLGVCLIYTRKQ